jgi:3-oxoacyl-[acyl-carrier protein] reductase
VSLIDLSNQVALVTGGSRGVGEATAVMLARAGAAVGIVYRAREADATRVVELIAQAGGTARAYRGDLSTRKSCDETVARVVSDLGRLDMYVANAGVWPVEDVAVRDMSDERWRHTMTTNLDSVFFGTRAALGAMQSGGRIVIVSSTAGQRGEAFHADYAATKGAIIAFVKSLAVEAAPDVNVNAIAPGWIDTEMSAVPYDRDGGAGRREIEAAVPLKRIASAEDTAGPIVFLCSTLARHVTGEILNVNGGAVLCG